MIKASKRTPSGPLLVVGLSEENIARLKNNQPIRTPLSAFGVELPGSLGIIYGHTERDLERQFIEGGLIGAGTEMRYDPQLDDLNAIKEQHEKILVCTVGLPRSGKTTWAKSQAYPIVNPDSVRLAIYGQRFIGQAEPFVWATVKAMVSALFLAGHQTVILDATCNTRARRDEWQSKEWTTFFKVFDASAEECKARAEKEGDDSIIPIITQMAERHEVLTDEEQRWP